MMVFEADAPGPDLLRVPPLLVVEVTSRSTKTEDWGRKRELYGRGGAAWYWIADPEADQLTVVRNDIDRFTVTQTLKRGGAHRLEHPFPVALDLAALFAKLTQLQ